MASGRLFQSRGAAYVVCIVEPVLPSPPFSRGIGLVLDLFRGEKQQLRVAGFWASFYAHAANFGLV